MPIAVVDRGRDNIIACDPAVLEQGTGLMILDGDNNLVTIEAPAPVLNIHFELGGSVNIHLGANLIAHSLFIYAAARSSVRLGRDVGLNGHVRLLLHEPGSITIGHGCLFGGGVDLSVSDMHSVIEVGTGKRVNPARDINVGNRVWIGERALVLKGVEIGEGAIVGAAAIVTKPIPPNCAAAGNPARVVRHGVTWDFRLLEV